MARAELPEALRGRSFTVEQARAHGVSRSRTVASDLLTPSRGVRIPVADCESVAASFRAFTDLDDSVSLAALSAARLFGAPLADGLKEDIRVYLARNRGRSKPRRKNAVGLRTALLPGETRVVQGVRVTSPERTWLDLAPMMPLEDLVACGDYFVCVHGQAFPKPRAPWCTLDDLRRVIGNHPGKPGVVKARRALEMVRVGADSVPETRLRLALIRAGLPEPELNVVLRTEEGRPVVWPNLSYRDHRLAIQYDGHGHGEKRQYLRDIRREEMTRSLGWTEVRIGAGDLSGARPLAVQRVMTALARLGAADPLDSCA